MAKKSKVAEVPREGVNTRITKDLREKLDAAAEAGGRSVGSEIERRLERSFKFKEELLALLEDERTFHAVAAIALTWMEIETITGRKWYDSHKTLIAAQAAAGSVVGSIRGADGSTASKAADGPELSEEIVSQLRLLGMLNFEKVRRRTKKEDSISTIDEAAILLGSTLFDGETIQSVGVSKKS
ncbi:Arc family DNA-binding protein [Methylobacterium sp. J-078]|uniref:Arc family DNA-binding protein n=1 Tax=Methylobacterium sp. J-078 TaxID=2836657 RepID=UPI001FBA9041|nr:Arc family DNA-binding protein [Methylobacterium sp. J-078]MCJ2042972.1 Arc family DNA-binding protein [Methylobacterium sp. J-078]